MTCPSSIHETGKQDTQSQGTGTTQRDGMGREGGLGQGDACTPVADSCQCMAKPTTILESN